MRKWWSFFCTTKSNITNHPVQASNTWDLVKEKAVEGKEAAAEWVKLNCVEKVNSMKENADDGITNSPVRKNSDFSILVKMAR